MVLFLGIYIGEFGKGDIFLCENDLLWDDNGNPIRTLQQLKSLDPIKYKFEGTGFNNRSYLNILDQKLLPSIYTKTINFFYMADNSPVHVAQLSDPITKQPARNYKDVCRKHNVETIDNWPPNSPGKKIIASTIL